MLINRQFLIKHIVRPIILGTVICIFINLFFNFGTSMFKEWMHTIILTFLFWKGNELIIRHSAKKLSWIKDTEKIIIRHVSFSVIYSLLVIFLFYLYIWFITMHQKSLHGFYQNFKYGFYICFTITFIAILFSYSFYFFKYWKKAVLSEEQLKRESLALQYESLKNQVNPHFLFNSLNVLTSLIEKDKDASIKYVKQLSDVFRYVLDQNVRELVPVETELKFIESYIFLQKIRFGDNFRVEITIKEKNFRIIPLAIQILIENAVKHNEISTDNPLIVKIFDNDNYLYVSNNKQLKTNLPESNQIGLTTLNFQYDFLAKEKMEVLDADNEFVVKLPKIIM